MSSQDAWLCHATCWIANVWWLFLNRLAVQFQQITAGCLFSAKDELRERAHQAEVGIAAAVKIQWLLLEKMWYLFGIGKKNLSMVYLHFLATFRP